MLPATSEACSSSGLPLPPREHPCLPRASALASSESPHVRLVYSLQMWLLVHFVLFCFRVFPTGLCSPHWRQGSGWFTLHPQPPAGRGVELACEGREPPLPASSCRPLVPLLSPLPPSSQYGLLLRPRSVPSGRAAAFTWEFCPLSHSLRRAFLSCWGTKREKLQRAA